MPTLRSQLTDLAHSFADAVIAAIRGTPLDDLLAGRGEGRAARPAVHSGEDRRTTRTRPAKQKPGRLPRRSPEEIAKAVDLVAKLVRGQPKGLRAEEIRKRLGLDVREMPRILR